MPPSPCTTCPLADICGVRLGSPPTAGELDACATAHEHTYARLTSLVLGASVELETVRRDHVDAAIAALALAAERRGADLGDLVSVTQRARAVLRAYEARQEAAARAARERGLERSPTTASNARQTA